MTNDAPRAVAVTPKDGHYFSGYYDICPWDATGRFLLAMRVGFVDHEPGPEDSATVGMVDLESGEFVELAETRSWNFQQGCFLQWLGDGSDGRVIYNDRVKDLYVSVILDTRTGKKTYLPMAVGAVSGDGRWGLTLNFARLHRTRPGYGYAGVADRYAGIPCPTADGIGLLDLETGAWRLSVSLAELYAAVGKPAERARSDMWVNHVIFNTDGSRYGLLYRWRTGAGHETECFTANADGTDLRRSPWRGMTSHYDWGDEKTILAYARMPEGGDGFWVATDGEEGAEPIMQEAFQSDGHCSYSNDRRWILNDTYPQGEPPQRGLFIYNIAERRAVTLGHFDTDTSLPPPCRCDLHPSWSRDDRSVCFDSIHEGRRAVYVMDVSQHTKA